MIPREPVAGTAALDRVQSDARCSCDGTGDEDKKRHRYHGLNEREPGLTVPLSMRHEIGWLPAFGSHLKTARTRVLFVVASVTENVIRWTPQSVFPSEHVSSGSIE